MREAELVMEGWAGRRTIACEVVGETPKRFRVRLLESGALPGRYGRKGEVVLVPKTAVAPKWIPTPESPNAP